MRRRASMAIKGAMRSANPALRADTFEKAARADAGSDRMTVNGTIGKTTLLLLLLVVTAGWTWSRFMPDRNVETIYPFMIGGAIGGLVFAFATIFKPTWAPVTAPVYAALQGLFVGGLSAILEAQFPGIVLQAVLLTFGVMLTMLLAYRAGVIKVTRKFRMGLVAATGGIFLIYMATWVLGFFGVSIPYIHGSGPIGIGFSVVVIIIAALNLVLDFDFIETGAEMGAPKHMEWYGAFGLIVTLVWLYIEILRLLSKLNRR